MNYEENISIERKKPATSKLFSSIEANNTSNNISSTNKKTMHKKSNSMKTDIQKYFIRPNISIPNTDEIQQKRQRDGESDADRTENLNKNNLTDIQPPRDSHNGGVNVNQSYGGTKGNSLLDKTPGILNNCEARKNLNDKILRKYKNNYNGGIKGTGAETGYPNKSEYPTTSSLYEKFAQTNKTKKQNLIRDDNSS